MSAQGNLKGGPASAGTTDTKVQRQSEGLPAFATLDNPSANPPTVAALDTMEATGLERFVAQNVQVLDTTRTNGLTDSQSLRASAPSAGL